MGLALWFSALGFAVSAATVLKYEWSDPVLACLTADTIQTLENILTIEACQKICEDFQHNDYECKSVDWINKKCYLKKATKLTSAKYQEPCEVFFAGGTKHSYRIEPPIVLNDKWSTPQTACLDTQSIQTLSDILSIEVCQKACEDFQHNDYECKSVDFNRNTCYLKKATKFSVDKYLVPCNLAFAAETQHSYRIEPVDYKVCHEAASAKESGFKNNGNDCYFIPRDQAVVSFGSHEESCGKFAKLAVSEASSVVEKIVGMLTERKEDFGFLAGGKKVMKATGEVMRATSADSGLPICQTRKEVSEFRCHAGKKCPMTVVVPTPAGGTWGSCSTLCNRKMDCQAFSVSEQDGDCLLCMKGPEDEGFLAVDDAGYALCGTL